MLINWPVIYYINGRSILPEIELAVERYGLIRDKFHDSREMMLSYIFAILLSNYEEGMPRILLFLKRRIMRPRVQEPEFMLDWIQPLDHTCHENRPRHGFFLSSWEDWLVFFTFIVCRMFFLFCIWIFPRTHSLLRSPHFHSISFFFCLSLGREVYIHLLQFSPSL